MITSVGGMLFSSKDVSSFQAKMKFNISSGIMGKTFHSPLTYARMRSKRAQGMALSGIARIAREGDQMMRIENGGKAISQIAASNFNSYF